ncbi:ras-related protein Rab-26-like [Nothobranchius furzeri]|uniref:Ras-related protein Rab-26-like n=1 Tax=Nothobranchius furzeri TaxID=105023 RepID=A0A9D2YHF3_NOTFU|nr:ras-related protein Rab-26-like [Nothobranchius furzeri]
MSRKKAAKGKAPSSSSGGGGSPSAASSAGKGARSSPGIVQMNGVVHPSRPSISNSSEFYDIAFKVMLVGDSGVGKTCLLVRFKDGAFLAGSFISTVGIDFRNKVLTIDGVKVKLQIWDTAGQERFRSVTHAYYRDAHALLLLYDVTNKSSFDNIQASCPFCVALPVAENIRRVEYFTPAADEEIPVADTYSLDKAFQFFNIGQGPAGSYRLDDVIDRLGVEEGTKRGTVDYRGHSGLCFYEDYSTDIL